MVEQIKELYEEAKIKYKEAKKPNNYIPIYIKRRLNFEITNEKINDIVFNISLEDRTCKCGNIIKFKQFGVPYSKHCSIECMYKDPEVIEKHSKIRKGKPCKLKGKTYKEIYGEREIKCGFQKGDKNIAKQQDIKEKISKGVKNSYDDALREKRRIAAYNSGLISNNYGKKYIANDGNYYRSNLEVKFVNCMMEFNIPFEYEKRVQLNNKNMKIVDFVIDNKIFVEITGYAYESWQKDFQKKIKWLRESIKEDDFIILLTYSNTTEKLFFDSSSNRLGTNILIGDITNTSSVLKTIEFVRNIIQFNKRMKDV